MPVNIITTTIADHLPQFLRAPNVFANLSWNKSKAFKRLCSNSNQENFILAYFSIDWKALLKTEQESISLFSPKI